MRVAFYIGFAVGSAIAVVTMAFVQFRFVLHVHPELHAFIVPALVGASFGAMVARALELSIRQRALVGALAKHGKSIEAQYARLVETTVDAILTLDPSGTIVLANPAAASLFGSSEEALKGRAVEDLKVFNASDHAVLRESLASVCGAGSHDTLPLTVIRPDGSRRVVEAVVQCTGEGCGGCQTLVVIRDVTDSRQREALADRVERMQRLEALGTLAGGVAHDFNNLLSVIMSNAELVEDIVRDPSVRHHTGAIRDAAERGASVTRQLLAFGRRQLLAPRVVDLGAWLSESNRIHGKVLQSHHELVSVAEDPSCRVEIDPAQLEQILFSLVVNACDAMPDGGAVHVEIAGVQDPAAFDLSPREDGWVRMSVQDTGDGMGEETLARCMEPFFTTKDRERGTGLGLSSVHGIVHQSRGRVDIESVVGEGTTVSVFLPATGAESSATPRRTSVVPAKLRGSVLLVEDEDEVREGLRRMLERTGLRVEAVADGEEAVAAFEAGRMFDVVVSDVAMPRMDGRALVEWLQRHRPDLPVLLATGHPGATPVEDDSDTVEVIRKPFSRRELVERLAPLLRDVAEDASIGAA